MQTFLVRLVVSFLLFGVLLTPMAVAQDSDGLAARLLRDTQTQGGLVVHVGCGDGRLAVDLAKSGNCLVRGYDYDQAKVDAARAFIQAEGPQDRVSFDIMPNGRIPLIDGVANLVIVEEPVKLNIVYAELLRVLAPNGKAVDMSGEAWRLLTKSPSPDTDEWTHYLHDPGNNAVAMDETVAPPRRMQWLAAPVWSRLHHTLASMSGLVTDDGRIFYVHDMAPGAEMTHPADWWLIARDAYNGVELWRRPITGDWADYLHGFRSGPYQLQRNMIAEDGLVFCPLGCDKPLSAFDAATGELVREYPQTLGLEEIVYLDGTLYALVGAPVAEWSAQKVAERRGRKSKINEKALLTIDAKSGETLWTWTEPDTMPIMPQTLAADDASIYFEAGKTIVCLDRATGETRWEYAGQGAGSDKTLDSLLTRTPGQSPSTLVVADGVVLWSTGRELSAVDAKTGEELWKSAAAPGFRAPSDVFVIDGVVWLGTGFGEGRDLRTGEILVTSTAHGDLITVGHHHRCYRNKASVNYIMDGKRGIEFVDLEGDDHSRNNWVRGTCQYGILPANGLIYAPPHACGCYNDAKLYGFWTLAPEEREVTVDPASFEQRLLKGPAYGAPLTTSASVEWPTLRGDSQRSGSLRANVGSELEPAWRSQPIAGAKLPTPATVAGGFAYLSDSENRTVLAIDAELGKTVWTYALPARVDSPPTYYGGLVLFGCADGRVYCLRADNGELVWRFDAAPEALSTVSQDQIESLWPVHGSVLVVDNTAYFSAGRSSYLDGGIFLWGLNPATGQVKEFDRVTSEHPRLTETLKTKPNDQGGYEKVPQQNAVDWKTFDAPDLSDAFTMQGGTISDVMTSDGESIFMRHNRYGMDLAPVADRQWHLYSTSRLIDGEENHRSHWFLGWGDQSRVSVAYSWIVNKDNKFGTPVNVPFGLMMAFDENTVWGIWRGKNRLHEGAYTLFRMKNGQESPEAGKTDFYEKPGPNGMPTTEWQAPVDMRPRAMLRAGDKIFIGGHVLAENADDVVEAFAGNEGGLLYVMSAEDGEKLNAIELPKPVVWDGLALANGRLYATLTDGSVVCVELE